MTSSRAKPAPACPGGLGASWRGWVLRPAGPALWGRGSAPPSLGAGTRTGRVGLGPGSSGPRIKAPMPSSLPDWDSEQGAVAHSEELHHLGWRWDLS